MLKISAEILMSPNIKCQSKLWNMPNLDDSETTSLPLRVPKDQEKTGWWAEESGTFVGKKDSLHKISLGPHIGLPRAVKPQWEAIKLRHWILSVSTSLWKPYAKL